MAKKVWDYSRGKRENPFKAEHKRAERDFSWDVPKWVTDQLVEIEYAGIKANEDGIPHQGCSSRGGTFWYKATIGVWKCTGCGMLARCYDGIPVGIRGEVI